ncbi:TerB family tellurite resistance protein [Pedobacter foliorum]|uniref:TerB family tellurite resistance protein n=1 Tax=Pedobacter foliorum TaxID=2739058 RepID=UPI001564969C|nr:TerB family tellurite resistance protein [Pedobacter foliorum]NRF41102.1 TerB family tellurite resistance protein [Pedobacter foliorum]
MKILLLVLLLQLSCYYGKGQSQEMQQLLLNVEKLDQFKKILKDMKKGYTIISNGYNTVRDLSRGNFNLHQAFLDGLMQVSPAVRKYKKVADIVSTQLLLVREYKAAYQRFLLSGNFSPAELQYIARVYDRLLKQSLDSLNDLLTVVTAGQLRMSDQERLSAIDQIYQQLQEKLIFLNKFNTESSLLSIQRSAANQDIQSSRELYGIRP